MIIKRNLITILLFAMFVVLPIVTIIMIHHITLTETLSKMDSGVMGDESVLLFLPTDGPDILYEEIDKTNENIAIYGTSRLDDGVVVRSIYFSKHYINLPMHKGRFFRKVDFAEDNFVAVIGKGLLDKTYKDKNEMYIDVGGVQYFVLGVIGYESKTVWDQMIFLNGLASSSLIDKQIYTLDFFSGDSQQVMGAIVEALFVKHHIEARILSANRSFLFSLLPRVLSARWFAAILLCMIASIILLSMEWVRRKKIVWSVKQMVGASRIRIVFELYLQYSSMLLLSLCGSSIYCTAIYPAYFNFLYTGYLLFMPFFLFFLVGSTIYLLSIPIREGLY